MGNHLDVVALLLDRGADPDRTDKQARAPLNIAAFQNHLAVVKLLVERGADRNNKSKWGTPLQIATKYNQPAVANYLRGVGAR